MAPTTRAGARASGLHGLALRLRGGGGDGGVYPLTHAEMQWMNPNERGLAGGRAGSSMLVIADGGGRAGNLRGQTLDWMTEETLRADRCTICAASQKALRAPIVVCELGYMYNKDELIEKMLNKKLPPDQAHITSLKCVMDATLCPNPNYRPREQAHVAGGDEDEVPFMCPVASVPMNGRHKFVFLRASGHIVSERAFKSTLGGRRCPVTETPIEPDEHSEPGRAVNVIEINGAAPHDSMDGREAREHLAARVAARKAASKQSKKAAKAGAGAVASETQPAAEAPMGAAGGGESGAAAKAAGAAGKAAAGKAAAAAGGKAQGKRVREWEEVVAAKAAASETYKSLFHTKEQKAEMEKQGNADFVARSVPARLVSGM